MSNSGELLKANSQSSTAATLPPAVVPGGEEILRVEVGMYQLVAAVEHGQIRCGPFGESAEVALFGVAEMAGRVALLQAAVHEGVQTAGGLDADRSGFEAAVSEEARGRNETEPIRASVVPTGPAPPR